MHRLLLRAFTAAQIIFRPKKSYFGMLLRVGLAIAAQLFDSACVAHIGFSLNSISLILMSGFITTAHRQVRMPLSPY